MILFYLKEKTIQNYDSFEASCFLASKLTVYKKGWK